MNDTPQGDGNLNYHKHTLNLQNIHFIRMNDTPQGDGNLSNIFTSTEPFLNYKNE